MELYAPDRVGGVTDGHDVAFVAGGDGAQGGGQFFGAE